MMPYILIYGYSLNENIIMIFFSRNFQWYRYKVHTTTTKFMCINSLYINSSDITTKKTPSLGWIWMFSEFRMQKKFLLPYEKKSQVVFVIFVWLIGLRNECYRRVFEDPSFSFLCMLLCILFLSLSIYVFHLLLSYVPRFILCRYMYVCLECIFMHIRCLMFKKVLLSSFLSWMPSVDEIL